MADTDIVPAHIIEEMRGSHQLGIFLRIGTDPALHLVFGEEDRTAKFDAIDEDGTIYLGCSLLGVPTLEVLVNGTADSVDFSLSGIDPRLAAKTIDSIPEVRGASVNMGLTTLDQYYQPMSAIIPVWEGTASHTGEQSPPVETGQNPTTTLSLTVVSGEATRSRAARSLWSGVHQKALSPTDEFCSGTARLARGVDPTWTLGY